jgi:protein gp37
MSKTSIEWTDVTWNPTRGCSRVSEGCRNCYAERIAARFSGDSDEAVMEGERSHLARVPIFEGFAARSSSGPRWTGKVELIEEKLLEPLHWKTPRRVFVNSMSDLFHEALPSEAIDRVFAVMALCFQHTFQVLTKRPERMFIWFKGNEPYDRFGRVESHMGDGTPKDWPLPNVWLGVSVEDQKTADKRIPLLLQTPAAVRFVSYEPALGPVDFTDWIGKELDWVIVGGESGPGARPANGQWFLNVEDQCRSANVPFFFKQWGEFLSCGETAKNAIRTDWGFVQRVGRKAAGRLLYGREWSDFPETANVKDSAEESHAGGQ